MDAFKFGFGLPVGWSVVWRVGKAGAVKKVFDEYAIVFSSDDKGAVLLGISLFSLLSQAHAQTRYRIYILEDRIQAVHKLKIMSLQSMFDCEIRFVPVHDLLERHVSRTFGQWPSTMYARFFLSSLLPEESLVLYLDIDTLVMCDVAELFWTDLGSALMGCVYQRQDAISEEWKRRLHIPPAFAYFNSGVLLMDLAKMRKERTEQVLLSYFYQYESILCYPDQDVLNAVLYDRVLGLHPKWNWHASHTRKLLFQFRRTSFRWGNSSIVETEEAACLPCIIHFPGLPKPVSWNYHFYGRLYRKIWRRSPWKDVPMTGTKRFAYLFRKMMYVPFDCMVRRQIRSLNKKRGGRGLADHARTAVDVIE